MCAVTKVADASGLVTATLSQLAQTISVVKNNYTKRTDAKVTILTCIKQNTKRKQRTKQQQQQQKQQNMAKSG